MLEVHFDTMSAVHRMRDAGFNEKQAEAMTSMVRDAISSGVATKTDVAELKGEIATLRAEMTVEIDSVRAEIEIHRAESKADNAELRGEMKSMQTNIRWIMVIGGFIAIAVAEPLLTRIFSWIG